MFPSCLSQTASWLAVLILPGGIAGCAPRSPIERGMTLTIAPSSHVSITGTNSGTLQVLWLGTSCYLLQVGHRAILTDPYLTHQSLARVVLGGALQSNPATVSTALAGLPVPDAIFVGHSHYDHVLDAAESLKQPGWDAIPVYGSVSTLRVLHSHGAAFTNGWRQVNTGTSWNVIAPGIRYQAIRATHGRQLPLLPLLYPGEVADGGPRPSRNAWDFRVGDTYAFLFELSDDRSTNTIYFAGAAHGGPDGFPDSSISTVDVAILCVPTWKLAKGYPANLIDRLQPRHIVASHYNNFFQVNHAPDELVPRADLSGFLTEAQKAAGYSRFEAIHVPSRGSMLQLR